MKLPFPLTIRFKSMLQSGIATRDLDVRWVSSLSWYFLNLFGLQSVFIFILGNENGTSLYLKDRICVPTNSPHGIVAASCISLTRLSDCVAANQMAQQMGQMNAGANAASMFQPGQDPDKVFKGEIENLEVVEHWYVLDGVEERILAAR